MTDAYTYIRYSTPDQQRGDSWRRQNEAVERFIAERGLCYRESAAFHDMGVSGFRGANLRSGLGKFIAEVQVGTVAKGSYLIVESLDRLSRQKLMDALGLVVSLVMSGIKVAALNDNGSVRVLDSDAGMAEVILALSSMQRANDESETKSHRVKAAWQQKKRNAAIKPVSIRCPEWLKWRPDEKCFEPVAERVAAVNRILTLADEGVGQHRIVKILNSEGVSSFRNPHSGWQKSSVGKLISNRALLGFYQPHRIEFDEATGRKRRVPDGEEIAAYYPKVVDVDLFTRVNARAYSLAKPLKGRQGAALSNLFSGFVYCEYCAAPMTLANKGQPPKGGQYLVCSKAVRGKDCRYRAWRYEDVEIYILAKLKELQVDAVLNGMDVDGRITQIKNGIAQKALLLREREETLENYLATIKDSKGRAPASLVAVLRELEESIDSIKGDIRRLQEESEALGEPLDPGSFSNALLNLYKEMDEADVAKRYLIRVRLRARISVLIERIDIRQVARGEPDFVGNAPNFRRIIITFRDGTTRTILPIGKDAAYSIDGVPKGGA